MTSYATPYGPVYVRHADVVRALGFTTGSRYSDYVLFRQRFDLWRAAAASRTTVREGGQRA